MNFIWMMLAFLILSGIALLFCGIIQVNIGEGLILSSAFIVLALFLSSFAAGTFIFGMYAAFLLAAAGGIFWCTKKIKEGKKGSISDIPAAYLLLLVIYVGGMVFLYHDFIQHIDELHQWAAAVKYMLEKDKLPTGYDFIGGSGQYGFATSLFHLFFQKISGYNEQNMYVSSMLLSWIGFLLPFSGCGRRAWKKILLYCAIVYIGLFTLYSYGPKSIYVDVPTAAWAGGLAGWWTERRKKRSDYLVVFSGLVMLHFFKQSAGLLMAVLTLIFMFLHTFAVESGYLYKKNGMRRITVLSICAWGLVFLGSFILYVAAIKLHMEGGHWVIAGISVPESLGNMFTYVKLSREKVFAILKLYITELFGEPLAYRSNLSVSIVPFILAILILFRACGDLFNKKREYMIYIYYIVFVSLSYFAAVYFSYVFMFAYELGIKLRSVSRYFSICALFLFVLLLTVLLQKGQAQKEYIRKYLALGILAFFMMGLNNMFIPNATAINKEKISGYLKIKNTVSQISKLNEILDEDDKVYYICQHTSNNLAGAELYNATALYYLDDQVSNYLAFPWKFTQDGSNVRLENSDIMIEALPDILEQNGFTYLWIFEKDNYLAEELPKVLNCGKIRRKSLYKIIYEEGEAVGLEYVQKL